MNREIHVRFWESAGVRFPCATQHAVRLSAFIRNLSKQEMLRQAQEVRYPNSIGSGLAINQQLDRDTA